MKYRHTIHECDLLVKDEGARRLKLRGMVLDDEVSGLKDQLAQRDSRIKDLCGQFDDVRSQLDGAHEKSRRQDNLTQSQAREIANLKVRRPAGCWQMYYRCVDLTGSASGGIVGLQRRVARLIKGLV
jgi:hypothetical protein